MAKNNYNTLENLLSESEHNADKYYGKKITDCFLKDDRLSIYFDDGKKIQIWDNGQSCCESRYITCDDNPKDLIGNKLVKIEPKEGPEIKNNYETHEQVFIEIATDKGFITMTTHNEHNGYYGGFGLTITENNPQ